VSLDSIGWSDCNSSLECLTQTLLIITFEGTKVRGRHSAVILRMIGVENKIASTVDDCVAIATRLGKNAQFQPRYRHEWPKPGTDLSRPRARNGIGRFPRKGSARLINQSPLSRYVFPI
jgi:hypothetical protein